MPWRETSPVEQRLEFVREYERELFTMTDLAAQYGISRKTGYKWLAQYEAEGVLAKNSDGKIAMTRVTLRPRVTWTGEPPDEAAIADLHHRAHEACFIANSVTTEVAVEH